MKKNNSIQARAIEELTGIFIYDINPPVVIHIMRGPIMTDKYNKDKNMFEGMIKDYINNPKNIQKIIEYLKNSPELKTFIQEQIRIVLAEELKRVGK